MFELEFDSIASYLSQWSAKWEAEDGPKPVERLRSKQYVAGVAWVQGKRESRVIDLWEAASKRLKSANRSLDYAKGSTWKLQGDVDFWRGALDCCKWLSTGTKDRDFQTRKIGDIL